MDNIITEAAKATASKCSHFDRPSENVCDNCPLYKACEKAAEERDEMRRDL